MQACVDKASASQAVECVMRGGVYDTDRDTVTIAGSGDTLQDVTISGYPGDPPVVIDGSAEVNATWRIRSPVGPAPPAGTETSAPSAASCVYESSPLAPTAVAPWQLWVADPDPAASGLAGGWRPLTTARWPNARVADLSVFDPAGGAFAHRYNY